MRFVDVSGVSRIALEHGVVTAAAGVAIGVISPIWLPFAGPVPSSGGRRNRGGVPGERGPFGVVPGRGRRKSRRCGGAVLVVIGETRRHGGWTLPVAVLLRHRDDEARQNKNECY